jgi:hypothetical protein
VVLELMRRARTRGTKARLAEKVVLMAEERKSMFDVVPL